MHRSLTTGKKAAAATIALSARSIAAAMTRRSMHTTSEVDPASKQGTTLYQHQDKLPHLPIPSIASTAQKFLDSARPFVSDVAPEAAVASDQNPTQDYERLKKAVDEFKSSDFVKELQSRLEKHAEGKDSWLIDWFNSASYFGTFCLLRPCVRKARV